ncbi:hypothetical protein GCM10023322_71420 [Rugosimonospora acidiphila]|uniref:Peptidase S8/S53 domain-containing protein n=1 Tax=Rugosimonospora acidiphila TaxID=556531 RepID=A0ABP9SLW6_9ACTN
MPRRTWLVLITLVGAVAAALTGSAVAAAAGPSYSKYYVVTASYQGKPENLSEIAGRLLHSTARSTEIFSLNVGVPQPDGRRLTDPSKLNAGWVLVLPWDATGAGVRYGLPTTAPPTAPSAGSPAASPQAAAPPVVQPAPPTPENAPPAPAKSATAGCAGTPKSQLDNQAQWATLRLAPQHAWPYSRGRGVKVAIVDSGVDATLPQLAKRVAVGSDIVGGTGRGDTDCLGSGTGMAAIVAGSADGAAAVGVAPDATVLPVRVAPTIAAVSEADQASAVEVAVASGATVIALGQFIDPALPTVASAIGFAVGHGVLVVSRASGTGQAAVPGLLRVGSIGIDGKASGGYPAGAADIVAPGVDVASLGIAGTGQVQLTGSQYAVAFVAGEAALIRARYTNLTVAEVIRRIEATADRIGSATPDPTYGFGLIDPAAAVTRLIPDERRGPDPALKPDAHSEWSAGRIAALITALVVAMVLVVLLALRIRWMVRGVTPQPALPDAPQSAGPAPAGESPAVRAHDPVPVGAGAPASADGVTGGTDADSQMTASAAPVQLAAGRLTGAETGDTPRVEQATPAAPGWWRHGPGSE